MDRKCKHVLLVNAAKEDNFGINRIHMGLTILGEILTSEGHQVKLIDYAFLRDLKHKIRVPEIEEVINEFNPDVVGLSVFTYLYDECQSLIGRIAQCCHVPIIIGGPHLTIFPDDFMNDNRISYIVRGEAEGVILHLIEGAKREEHPVIIDCPLPSPDEIPELNLDIAYGSQYLSEYQIQLSRGCPYNCVFCNIRFIAGRRIRERDLETCLIQIVEAKKRYPNIKTITITDDCPTLDKERFKQFLRMFRESNTGCELTIDNVRANLIDEEILDLYIAAGGQNICLGTEAGHPEVFKLIHKGETLEEIVNAGIMIRKKGLMLGLCFVIGLPEDNLKRHFYSMRMARHLKPDYIFWNMCVPWPGTDLHQWFQQHGEIGDIRNFSTLIDPRANFGDPPCSTPEFPKEDRIKAWLMANMETHNYFKNLRDIMKILSLAHNYKIYRSLIIYIAKYFIPNVLRLMFWKMARTGVSTLRALKLWPPPKKKQES
jgi:anaerobic magnesium-protoporphyrin IX monomethyl ester cyclase